MSLVLLRLLWLCVQGVSDEGVCTIEAMFFFLKALAEQVRWGRRTWGRRTCTHTRERERSARCARHGD